MGDSIKRPGHIQKDTSCFNTLVHVYSNKETTLMAILRGLLFHWSAMTWLLGMDTRLRLGREICVGAEIVGISGPDFELQNYGMPRFRGRISSMCSGSLQRGVRKIWILKP
jgi:hypothetical protein